MNLREIGEFGLIERLRAKLNPADETVIVGIGDDAAVLAYHSESQVLLTTDMLVEGVHFREDTMDFRSLGWKSIAASLSDIAAMGGIPRHVAVSLALPSTFEVIKLEELYVGMAEICTEYSSHIIGGDVVKTEGPLVISITASGEVEQGQALLRNGARPGDVVFVTGQIGGSAAGLAFLESDRKSMLPVEEQQLLMGFHQRPVPQISAGRILRLSGKCTSCNDISDGLASELNEIASASGVKIGIEANRIPISKAVTQFGKLTGEKPLNWALYGGEDYQLTGTIDPLGYQHIEHACHRQGIKITKIGNVSQGIGVTLETETEGEVLLTARGYNHF